MTGDFDFHQGGLYREIRQLQIAGHFVAEQQGYFLQQPSKSGGGGVLVAHDS